eukprot:Sspe_Gene.29326::Locus_13857_Transcript_1_1_Confidence_1.000_Length_651::g.29326::m.29326/K03626/EGD2, NACA; nascent polypeptide-associated complex subunit alpha
MHPRDDSEVEDSVFVIAEPDVYKSPAANTYVIFGEAKVEDTAEERDKRMLGDMLGSMPVPAPEATEEEEGDEEVDAEGLDANDIEMVMTQAKVSKNKAIKALKSNNGDIVNTIMALSS